MDQIYLFYEKLKKEELDNQRSEAVTLSNALIYASPSHEQSDARKKQQSWNKFMDSLTWDKLKTEKKVKTVKDVKQGFFNIPGLPIKKL